MNLLDERLVGDARDEFTFAQCIKCKHYSGGFLCAAFKRIPDEIYDNEHDHRKPYPGDKGIRFEPIEKNDLDR